MGKGFRLAIIGKMRSGKDTLYKNIRYTTPDLLNVKFAQPMKNAFRELRLPATVGDVDLEREFAQYVGTDLVRTYIPNHWVDVMQKEMDVIDDLIPHMNVIITDCRFPNELDWCMQNGFITVKLNVSREAQVERGANQTRLYHESERALDNTPDTVYDIVVAEDHGMKPEGVAEIILRAVNEPYWYESGSRLVIDTRGATFIPNGE